jgi:hypothetical protein
MLEPSENIENKDYLVAVVIVRNGVTFAYVYDACISMTTRTRGRVRGKGLTRRLAGSSPPASEKRWMTPPV